MTAINQSLIAARRRIRDLEDFALIVDQIWQTSDDDPARDVLIQLREKQAARLGDNFPDSLLD